MILSPSPEYLAIAPQAAGGGPVSAWGLLRLRRELEKGLPLTPQPYRTLADRSGLTEDEVMAAVRQWQAQGLIKRLGLVVKHRTLGYTANAMVVWDIPDEQVHAIGQAMARMPFVTLCYQRPRRLPDWPYNLFAMIHGASRDEVEEKRIVIAALLGQACRSSDILYSSRILKKTGLRLRSKEG